MAEHNTYGVQSIMSFQISECRDLNEIKELFLEYSKIKGAESCFVALDKELRDLDSYYSGGALLVGYEDDEPVACIAIRKLDEHVCEGKRLYIRPEHRGKGYARIMLSAMLNRAKTLGFTKLQFTTKPEVMKIGYELYKRMGFEEYDNADGVAYMRVEL